MVKKIVIMFLTFFILMTFGCTQTKKTDNKINATDNNEKHVVVFKDSVLEKKIREAINKPAGEILAKDLSKIAILDASWDAKNPAPMIQYLDGLQYLTNLEKLNLSLNHTTDLTPLSTFKFN